MARKHLDPLDFRFDVDWPTTPTSGGDPLLDASVGKLSIGIQDTTVTAFKSDKGDVGTELNIPLYMVAEWIASNWWPLLFEPIKTDLIDNADEDIGFRSRHWLGYARDGFALPDLWFYPLGDEIEVSAYAKYLSFARIDFLNSASASVPTNVVRDALRSFVDEVLQKLNSAGIKHTTAHQAWEQVRATKADEEDYCRLIGSLGLSPYEEHGAIDRIIDHLLELAPISVVSDLFQASNDDNLSSLASLAQRVWDLLPKSRQIDISGLMDIELPKGPGVAPWQWGKDAARRARTSFGIEPTDPQGGHAFFDKLGIDPSQPDLSGADGSTAKLSGGLQRHDMMILHMALAEPQLPRRRFAAARGAFLGWSSDIPSHLITAARTREQQASRAFAAELLAPIDFIRRKAGGSAISMYRVEEIATELEVSPAVVKWQAHNNNLHVVDMGTW
jgi:hypothetical protein